MLADIVLCGGCTPEKSHIKGDGIKVLRYENALPYKFYYDTCKIKMHDNTKLQNLAAVHFYCRLFLLPPFLLIIAENYNIITLSRYIQIISQEVKNVIPYF